MSKYTFSLSCESVKVEAYDHKRIAVDLGFAASDDLFEAVKDEIDAADLLEHIHLDGAVSAILEAYGEDEGFWPELERQSDRLTLESVQNQVNEIDEAVDNIETQVGAIDANDPDDVQQVVRMVERYIKTIRQQLSDLRP
jgi:hypothetical protein